MSDGFRSAEIGAPEFAFTSACKPGCSATTGHARACALSLGVVWTLPPAPTRAACPHCGVLGNATIAAGPTTTSAT